MKDLLAALDAWINLARLNRLPLGDVRIPGDSIGAHNFNEALRQVRLTARAELARLEREHADAIDRWRGILKGTRVAELPRLVETEPRMDSALTDLLQRVLYASGGRVGLIGQTPPSLLSLERSVEVFRVGEVVPAEIVEALEQARSDLTALRSSPWALMTEPVTGGERDDMVRVELERARDLMPPEATGPV